MQMPVRNHGILFQSLSRGFTMYYVHILFSVEFQKSPMRLSMVTDEDRTMATR